MRRIFKYMLLAILIGTVLACGVISNPLAGAQNLASTAQALASAIPSGLPDVTKYLNPQGKPVSDWNGIPIMPEASAGEEFSKGTYSFRVSGVDEPAIQSFYNDKLKAQGWSSPFSAQGGGSGGLMLFTKDTHVLTITITKVDADEVVLLSYQ
jgi:hypothetical protein